MSRLLAAALAVLALLAAAPLAAAADGGRPDPTVLEVGHDVTVNRTVERIVVVGGDVTLGPQARVTGDLIAIFGDVHAAPGARVEGSQYVAGAGLIDWIPGPGWVAGLLLLAALLVYRIAVWAAVSAIAATLTRTAAFERWSGGWERRPGRALAAGVVAVAVALPMLGLLALTGIGLPLALLGLAALLVACGAGLALFREGPLWPRRPNRWAYAAYLLLPPALEVGLLLTAAGGLGAAIVTITRDAARRDRTED
jgi:hypothetical protein